MCDEVSESERRMALFFKKKHKCDGNIVTKLVKHKFDLYQPRKYGNYHIHHNSDEYTTSQTSCA